MFHTYTFPSTAFQDWLTAANQLYLTQYFYLGGHKKDYRPLQQQLNPQSQDQYILYVNDQVGVCGSAIITPSPYDFEIDGQLIPKGTWALGNVLFYIKARTPFDDQMKAVDRITTHFHEGLFDHLWNKAQASGHQMALSFQATSAIHQDLQFFGGFTLQHEKFIEEDDQCLSIAVMPVTAATYQTYVQTKKKNIKRINTYPTLLGLQKVASILEVSR